MRTKEDKLIYRYWKDIEAIPIFIDNRNIKHNNCREIANQLFSRLSNLMEPKFLTPFRIKTLANYTDDQLNEIIKIDEDIFRMYLDLLLNLFTYYKIETLAAEQYEETENIRKFLILLLDNYTHI